MITLFVLREPTPLDGAAFQVFWTLALADPRTALKVQAMRHPYYVDGSEKN